MAADLPPLEGLDAEWRMYASCGSVEDEWWDEEPENGEVLIDLGKIMCEDCPSRIECHDDDILYGFQGMVRGGVDTKQKLVIGRHRTRYQQYFAADVQPVLEYVMGLSREVQHKLAA